MSWWLPLNGSRIAQFLACKQAELSIQSKAATTQNNGSNQFEGGSQNNKVGGDTLFFVQNHTGLNNNPAAGKQHACNDSVPEGR